MLAPSHSSFLELFTDWRSLLAAYGLALITLLKAVRQLCAAFLRNLAAMIRDWYRFRQKCTVSRVRFQSSDMRDKW